MSKEITSMDAKIDEMQANWLDTWLDAKMTNIVAGMDSIGNQVDEKIDDLGLRINSVNRGMDWMYGLNKTVEESLKMVNKKIDRYEVMLRRILGFYQKLEDLSIQQSQVAKDVEDLHTLTFPNNDKNLPAAEDDDVDETGTQYNNNQRYNQRLGDGPALTLFPSPEPSSEIPSAPVPHLRFPPPGPNMLTWWDHIMPIYWYGFFYFPLPIDIPIPKYALFFFFSLLTIIDKTMIRLPDNRDKRYNI